MRVLIPILLVVALAGCSSELQYEQVGIHSDQDFLAQKKEYLEVLSSEQSHQLSDRLENMIASARNQQELDWATSKLMENLENQNEYQAIIEYINQLKLRSLSPGILAKLHYIEADTYHKLSKSRWAAMIGAKHVYRNFDYLRTAQDKYNKFVSMYPNDKRVPEIKKELKNIKVVLEQNKKDIQELNSRPRAS